MRKMTYTQAATCGENLKVRVTPEQSEKMQKAWFAAGKTWHGRSVDVKKAGKGMLFLYEDRDMAFSSSEHHFNNHRNEEIELIDYLPQSDFASQQEVWDWLSEKNKQNKVISKDSSIIAGFSMCGNLFDYKNNEYFAISGDVVDFSNALYWKKYTPPHIIRVNGVEVPAPLESLDGVNVVYIPSLHWEEKYIETGADDDDGKAAFKSGTAYATKEDAIKRTEAMLKFEVVE